jgi:ABC-type branched-subunit amino acid transport system ATPase component
VTALLEADDVRVVFGGVRALDGASLSVEDGRLCGLIGPNGSGKSTMLGALSRMTDLTSGALRLDGRDYADAAPHEANRLGIARTFQTVRLLPGMTVQANVMFGAGSEAVRRAPVVNWLDLRRAASDEARARAAADAALQRVAMSEHRDDYPLDLPYGKQRRVEIARALAADPRILLLDEPTAGMSQAERREIGALLADLHADGLTQILVEHDLAMIHRICDSCVALNFGKVIARGTPREVAEDPDVLEAYVGRRTAQAELSDDAPAKAGPS